MRYSIALFLAAAAASAQPSSTHDDPIIITRGSVQIIFGVHTRAILASQWQAKQQDGRYLYYQHAHLEREREIHTIFREGTGINAQAKEFDRQVISPQDQRGLKIEIFLKGKPKNGGPMQMLGPLPQLILKAVPVETPSCAHPYMPDGSRIGEDLRFGRWLCSSAMDMGKSTSPWSWELSSDLPLDGDAMSNGVSFKHPRWQANLLLLKYVNPAFTDIAIDHWDATVRPLPGSKKPSWICRLFRCDCGPSAKFVSTKGKGPLKSRISDCAAIEICANEKNPLDQNFCLKTPQDCGLSAVDTVNPTKPEEMKKQHH